MIDDDRTFNIIAKCDIFTQSGTSSYNPQETRDPGYVAVSGAADNNTILIYTISDEIEVRVYFDVDEAERYALELLSAVAFVKGPQ